MAVIFHLAEAAHWSIAQQTGSYLMSTRGTTLEDEGFIHASDEQQWPSVRHAFYEGVDDDLQLLLIDPERLTSNVIREIGNPQTGEVFPHVYGPITTDAVSAVHTLHPPHVVPGDDRRTAFRSAAVIAAPPMQVWRVLTDWGRAHRWLPGVQALAADGPTRAGTTLTCATENGPRQLVLVELDAPTRLVLKMTRGPLTASYRFTLGRATVERAPATVLTLVTEVDDPSLSPQALKRVRAFIAERDRMQPQLLRDVVEGPSGQSCARS